MSKQFVNKRGILGSRPKADRAPTSSYIGRRDNKIPLPYGFGVSYDNYDNVLEQLRQDTYITAAKVVRYGIEDVPAFMDALIDKGHPITKVTTKRGIVRYYLDKSE